MHINKLDLVNVRKFEKKSIEFTPRFNLLVGKNGAGKSTILRSIYSTLSKSYPKDDNALTDEDHSFDKTYHKVNISIVSDSPTTTKTFQYSRDIGKRANRSRSQRPPLLTYFANEACCSSFKSHKRNSRTSNQSSKSSSFEDFLYERGQRSIVSLKDIQKGKHFGSPNSVRHFILHIIRQFSPKFDNFTWEMMPANCAINFPEKKVSNDAASRRFIKAFKKILLDDIEKRAPFEELIMSTLTVNSKGLYTGTPDKTAKEKIKISSPFGDIAQKIDIDSPIKYLISKCTVTVNLKPRISIRDQNNNKLLLSQLSDGEQRIFSIIVDIARQLDKVNLDNLKIPGDQDFEPTDFFHHIGNASAIILIDEIDVHLHPKWQRMIVPLLEDIFPNCQFIATTHSPYVIQSASEHTVQNLDKELLGNFADKGIEEITYKVLDIEDHQVSKRYFDMLNAAKEYFKIITAKNTSPPHKERLKKAREKLDELKDKYHSNPAFQAYLEMHQTLEENR